VAQIWADVLGVEQVGVVFGHDDRVLTSRGERKCGKRRESDAFRPVLLFLKHEKRAQNAPNRFAAGTCKSKQLLRHDTP
jgi:hypothetical protein